MSCKLHGFSQTQIEVDAPDPNPVSLLAQDFGYPAQLGDPKLLPAHGGYVATRFGTY
jgi:hypothetical protein